MEHAAVIALLLSLIAGLATSVGSLFVLLAKTTSRKFLALMLGFSAGVMVFISIEDLYPAALDMLWAQQDNKLSGGFLAIGAMAFGMLLAAGIDRFVPQKPLAPVGQGRSVNQQLLRVGAVNTVAIMLHNLPEGISTFMAGYHSLELGLPVALAVAMHNIPEGIAVSIPIYYGSGSRKKAFGYAALSGLTEPLGAVLAYFILAPFMSEALLGLIFACVAGIMLFISFHELIPASDRCGHHKLSVLGILSGVCVMAVGLLLG